MTTYYYAVASRKFLLEEEPLQEVIEERIRNYNEREKAIDFWMIDQPAFLDAPELAEMKARCPQPAAAMVSTDPVFITWFKLRVEHVLTGEFDAPSDSIPDAIASLTLTA